MSLQSVPKTSGSAFDARLGVKRADFRLVQGGDLIETFEAPVRQSPRRIARTSAVVADLRYRMQLVTRRGWRFPPASSTMIRNFVLTNTFL